MGLSNYLKSPVFPAKAGIQTVLRDAIAIFEGISEIVSKGEGAGEGAGEGLV